MKNKLELQWTNKNKALYYDPTSKKYEWVDKKDPRVSEPRILIEKKLYGDKNTENILIKGDNLLGLKALLQDYQNSVKLIYIDPPFNTGSAFDYYDDGFEHSVWLTLMRDRLILLKNLLSNDGAIYVHIDDNEQAYLKIVMDEIFGRDNFITTIVLKSGRDEGVKMTHKNKRPVKYKEFVLLYAKNKDNFSVIPQYKKKEEWDDRYSLWLQTNKSKDPKDWDKITVNNKIKELDLVDEEEILKWKIENSDKIIRLAANNSTIVKKSRGDKYFQKIITPTGLEKYVYDGQVVLFASNKLKNFGDQKLLGEYIGDWWDDIAYNNLHNEGNVDLKNGKKPESLIRRIIDMSTQVGDIVLDSFAGSGTTGAVAHKMNRKWIMIELGDQAESHIIKRLNKVIQNVDPIGITNEVGWKGGGGFKYFELGDSLFVRDEDLRLTVINPKMYNGALIRAVLKIERFRLKNPDNGLHGISGTTAAHVTEQYLTQEYVDTLLNEIGDQAKFLVIYAKTISSKLKVPNNVEIRRIPDVLLKKFNV